MKSPLILDLTMMHMDHGIYIDWFGLEMRYTLLVFGGGREDTLGFRNVIILLKREGILGA